MNGCAPNTARGSTRNSPAKAAGSPVGALFPGGVPDSLPEAKGRLRAFRLPRGRAVGFGPSGAKSLVFSEY